MNMIASVDENWGIGFQNRLLAQIPEDMAFFKKKTMGNVVVMGRKTLESLPGGEPLKGRTNFVLSRNHNYQGRGARVLCSLEQLRQALLRYNSEDIYVMGGEAVYRQLLEFCDTAYVTKISHTYQADAFLPDLDKMRGWELTEESGEKWDVGVKYRFLVYKRKGEHRVPQRGEEVYGKFYF